MSICKSKVSLNELELPREFEDLDGLMRTDLKAVVKAIAQRANERLLLTRREYRDLQIQLWNGLTDAINTAVAPLSAENR